MRTYALFGVKKFGFFKIYGVSARTRGKERWASADILRTRRRWSIFRDFVRTPLMDAH